MFRITGGRGFHIKLSNGITISTQFGGGNYCDNYDAIRIGSEIEKHKGNIECSNVEVAIFIELHGQWLTKEVTEELFPNKTPDRVLGYITMEQWLKIVNYCANIPKEEISKRLL